MNSFGHKKVLPAFRLQNNGPNVKHDHGPYVVLHGPVWTLQQNEDLQS